MPRTPSFLNLDSQTRIAYHYSPAGKNLPPKPVICFLGGLMSDMSGTKATYLENYCQQRGYPFLRLDYTGHGLSSGEFINGTLSDWKRDVLAVIDHIKAEKILLVGSSLGGWISLLVMKEISQHIHGFIGVASAPDFTKILMWDCFDDHIKQELQSKGVYPMPSAYDEDCAYPISMKLITDGNQHLVLSEKTLNYEGPVRLIHGMEDSDVPYRCSLAIAETITSEDVIVELLKNADHRLSDQRCLDRITYHLEVLLQR